jgi:hypothetical protein
MKHHCHFKRYKTNQSPERIKRKALDLQRNEEKGNWVSLITPNQEIDKERNKPPQSSLEPHAR